jgi:hypothetical protein
MTPKAEVCQILEPIGYPNDRRTYWHDRWGWDFDAFLRDDESRDASRVEEGVSDGARAYGKGQLDDVETLLFEEFFIASSKFRRRAIVEIALITTDDGYEEDEDGNLIEVDRVAELFAFENSTPEQLREAQSRYDAIAAGTRLAAVDVRTGDIAVDQRPASELDDAELIRRCLDAADAADRAELECRAAHDTGVRALHSEIRRMRQWVNAVQQSHHIIAREA